MANLKNTSINDTGFFKLPVGDTAARPASPTARQLRFNTDTGELEQFRPGLGAWIAPSNTGVIATGGDAVYDVETEGTTYRVHVFTATGTSTFSVLQGGEAEYLIVAGGGGGQAHNTGGAGGGGVITGTSFINPGNFNVTVGSGGSGANLAATNGEDSEVFGLTALGGGHSGRWSQLAPSAGGSGAGGNAFSSSNATYTDGKAALQPGSADSGFGNAGGDAFTNSSDRAGGGGGGAGGAGGDARSDEGGHGGIGISSNITGISNFFAGGGGGAHRNSGDIAEAGLGGAGRGESLNATKTDLSFGVPNTGGGAGGIETGANNDPGRTGGSGIVIIRYPLRQNNPETAAGQDVRNGLVLDLDFAKPTVYNGSGSVVTDSRLTGVEGSINGPTFVNPRTHRSAFEFDGSNDNILIPNPFDGNQENFSVSVWARAFSASNNRAGIIQLDGTSSNKHVGGIIIGLNRSTSLRIRHWNDGGTNYTWSNSDFTSGVWHNFVLVIENKSLKVFENSVQKVNSSFSGDFDFDKEKNLRIGEYTFSSNFLDGEVGRVTVYNTALSENEIDQQYEATRWRFGV